MLRGNRSLDKLYRYILWHFADKNGVNFLVIILENLVVFRVKFTVSVEIDYYLMTYKSDKIVNITEIKGFLNTFKQKYLKPGLTKKGREKGRVWIEI